MKKMMGKKFSKIDKKKGNTARNVARFSMIIMSGRFNNNSQIIIMT